jgi:radical SAM protein with 4Fe4S-binding SPASM domain
MKFPIQHIIFEITQQCNLSCIYCYNHWRRDGYSENQYTFKQTKQTLKKIFDSIDFQHITFTGGEPFLADGLKEFVLDCRFKKKSVSIISNGTVANVSDYQFLEKLGISLIEIPLHSYLPSIHNSLTCNPASFDKVMESIHFLTKSKIDLCVICVLTKLNMDSFQKTLNFAESLGIKRFMIARYNIGGRGIKNTEDILPSLSGLQSVFRIANDYMSDHKMKISSNVCIPFCIINPKEYPNIPISSCSTDMSKRPFTIDSIGNIRLCNHSPYIAGNIHSESIDSIIKSEYVTSWKTTVPKFCSNCTKWLKCQGGCRAASEQMGKSLEYEDPIIGLI